MMIEKQEIRNYLTAVVGKDVSFEDDDSLIVAQLIDSLKVAELIVYLESTYQISFDPDDLNPDNLDTINSIAKFLERRVN
jgi:acyl carrier protein